MKSQSQSTTIRATVRQLVINAATLFAVMSGEVVDVDNIDKYAGYAGLAAMLAYNFWETRNVVKGRVEAKTPVETLPWHKDAFNFIKWRKK